MFEIKTSHLSPVKLPDSRPREQRPAPLVHPTIWGLSGVSCERAGLYLIMLGLPSRCVSRCVCARWETSHRDLVGGGHPMLHSGSPLLPGLSRAHLASPLPDSGLLIPCQVTGMHL